MNLKEQVAQLEAAKEVAQSYAAKFKTQASSEGLENIADDFIAGAKWAIEKLQTPQPEAFWNDNQVMSFVNWYIELKNLDSRYELENQFIIDSFKAGDAAEKWKATPAENSLPEGVKPEETKIIADFLEWFDSPVKLVDHAELIQQYQSETK